MTVQAGLCKAWSEPKLLVFPRTGSYEIDESECSISFKCFYLSLRIIINVSLTYSYSSGPSSPGLVAFFFFIFFPVIGSYSPETNKKIPCESAPTVNSKTEKISLIDSS